MKDEDEKFLIYHLDLPSELESDFRMARNLFQSALMKWACSWLDADLKWSTKHRQEPKDHDLA